MNNNFREKVQSVSDEAINLLSKGITGKMSLEGGLMDRLIRLVGQGEARRGPARRGKQVQKYF